jgi:hypothetical protein
MRQAKFTKLLTVAVSEEVHLKVKEITDEKGISIGEWFRDAADKVLAEEGGIDHS